MFPLLQVHVLLDRERLVKFIDKPALEFPTLIGSLGGKITTFCVVVEVYFSLGPLSKPDAIPKICEANIKRFNCPSIVAFLLISGRPAGKK